MCVFDWTKFREEGKELRVLRNFALMPSVLIPVEVSDWLKCDINTLDEMTESGWLLFREENGECGYFMHPLEKEVLLLRRDKFPESIGEEMFSQDDPFLGTIYNNLALLNTTQGYYLQAGGTIVSL